MEVGERWAYRVAVHHGPVESHRAWRRPAAAFGRPVSAAPGSYRLCRASASRTAVMAMRSCSRRRRGR